MGPLTDALRDREDVLSIAIDCYGRIVAANFSYDSMYDYGVVSHVSDGIVDVGFDHPTNAQNFGWAGPGRRLRPCRMRREGRGSRMRKRSIRCRGLNSTRAGS